MATYAEEFRRMHRWYDRYYEARREELRRNPRATEDKLLAIGREAADEGEGTDTCTE